MSDNKIVYLRVDELDEKPRLFRRLSDPIPRQFIQVPNFHTETSYYNPITSEAMRKSSLKIRHITSSK